MKLYTRKGDDGTTGLFGGQRVAKDDPRVAAYGDIDELNSFVAHAASACEDQQLVDMLSQIEHRLFEIGADLAAPARSDEPRPQNQSVIPRVTDEHVHELESYIDELARELPPMDSFILPGGSELAGRLHIARCVCRRAERACVSLDRAEPLGSPIGAYLNRLSDLLFAMARRANQIEGIDDIPWISPRQQTSTK